MRTFIWRGSVMNAARKENRRDLRILLQKADDGRSGVISSSALTLVGPQRWVYETSCASRPLGSCAHSMSSGLWAPHRPDPAPTPIRTADRSIDGAALEISARPRGKPPL
jgi:hypothetical protein